MHSIKNVRGNRKTISALMTVIFVLLAGLSAQTPAAASTATSTPSICSKIVGLDSKCSNAAFAKAVLHTTPTDFPKLNPFLQDLLRKDLVFTNGHLQVFPGLQAYPQIYKQMRLIAAGLEVANKRIKSNPAANRKAILAYVNAAIKANKSTASLQTAGAGQACLKKVKGSWKRFRPPLI
jgi:hypothetical protein